MTAYACDVRHANPPWDSHSKSKEVSCSVSCDESIFLAIVRAFIDFCMHQVFKLSVFCFIVWCCLGGLFLAHFPCFVNNYCDVTAFALSRITVLCSIYSCLDHEEQVTERNVLQWTWLPLHRNRQSINLHTLYSPRMLLMLALPVEVMRFRQRTLWVTMVRKNFVTRPTSSRYWTT